MNPKLLFALDHAIERLTLEGFMEAAFCLSMTREFYFAGRVSEAEARSTGNRFLKLILNVV